MSVTCEILCWHLPFKRLLTQFFNEFIWFCSMFRCSQLLNDVNAKNKPIETWETCWIITKDVRVPWVLLGSLLRMLNRHRYLWILYWLSHYVFDLWLIMLMFPNSISFVTLFSIVSFISWLHPNLLSRYQWPGYKSHSFNFFSSKASLLSDCLSKILEFILFFHFIFSQ